MSRINSIVSVALLSASLLVAGAVRLSMAQPTPSQIATPASQITICGSIVPETLQQANATFETHYTLQTDDYGRPSKISKLRPDMLDEVAVIDCLRKWILPATNAKVTVSLRWEHAKGWTRLSIALPGQPFRQITIDPGWPF